MRSGIHLLTVTSALLIAVGARAGVQIEHASVSIDAYSSYWCSEEVNDISREGSDFSQLVGLDQMFETSIVGPCGSGNASSHVAVSVTGGSIELSSDCTAGASGEDLDAGGYGNGSYDFEVWLTFDAPTSLRLTLSGSGGGQGNSGAGLWMDLVNSEEVVLFDGDIMISSLGNEPVTALVDVPAGPYLLRGGGGASAYQDGGGFSGVHSIEFLDAVDGTTASFGTLKARY